MKITDTQKCLQILKRSGLYGIHSFHLNKEIGTTRSAARIEDLKKLGYTIESVPETLNGCRGCRYFLRTSPTKLQDIARKPIRYEFRGNTAIPIYA